MRTKFIKALIIIASLSVCKYVPTAVGETQPQALASQGENRLILRGIEDGSPFVNKSTQSNPTDVKPEAVPGSDAVMTPDLLLVSPKSEAGNKTPEPLKAFVGASLTLKIEDRDIALNKLPGIMISVVNDTTRPLVIDGDTARALVGEKSYTCASVQVIQKSILPANGGKAMVKGVFTKVVPAAVSVGWVPTLKDIHTINQPVRMRYGPDEIRRLAEESRFGERVLWPHQKTEGIIYFPAGTTLTGAKIEMPVHTLFDATDRTVLTGS